MLNHARDYLSIWEIAHRWYGYDPNQFDGNTIPLDAQDLLRLFTTMMVQHELAVLNENGIQLKCYKYYIPEVENFAFEMSDEDKASIDAQETEEDKSAHFYSVRGEYYADFCNTALGRHHKATENFEDVYKRRIYNKEELERVCLSREEIIDFCKIHKQKLPSFWFSEVEIEELHNLSSPLPPLTDDEKTQLKQLTLSPSLELEVSGQGFPTHDLSRLNIAAKAAYDKFWLLYDPADRTTSPNAEVVHEFLRDEHGLTVNAAKVIQTVIRDPKTKSGGTKS